MEVFVPFRGNGLYPGERALFKETGLIIREESLCLRKAYAPFKEVFYSREKGFLFRLLML